LILSGCFVLYLIAYPRLKNRYWAYWGKAIPFWLWRIELYVMHRQTNGKGMAPQENWNSPPWANIFSRREISPITTVRGIPLMVAGICDQE